MEYAQSLLNWFSESQATGTDESRAATHLPPPDFLSVVRRNRRGQFLQATPTGGEPLTALELRLRDLVLDLYSDQRSSSASLLRPSESEDLSEIDSGHFSDRPTTSEPHLRSPSPPAMEPHETTPLHSYDNRATPGNQNPPPVLPTFSADDIAEVGQDPNLPSLRDSSVSSFQFGFRQPLPQPGSFSLPASPYGVRSQFNPPPTSLPLYSHTEPSLSLDHSPRTSSAADLRSLVSRSFQLSPQTLPSTKPHPRVAMDPSSTLATPTSVSTTPTESQATPPASTGESETSRDKGEPPTDDSSGKETGSDGSPPHQILPYTPSSCLPDIQSPLSPREIRDRLADVAGSHPPRPQLISLSTTTPRGEKPSGSGEGKTGDGGDENSELQEKEVVELHNFEDAETSSVVSIEQITEALRHDPLPTPLPDGEKTPTHNGGSHAFSLPLSSFPLHTRAGPLHSKYSKSALTPPTMRMPEHIRPAHTPGPLSLPRLRTSREAPSLPLPLPSSEQQLSEVLHAQAHLQGQLEAVTDECRELLKERAALSSKLAVSEAELEVARRERTNSSTTGSGTKSDESAELREQLQKSQRELRQERQAAEATREDLARVRASEQRLKAEMVDGKRKEGDLAEKVRELGQQVRESGRELEEERVSREEALQQLSSLQASHQAAEESKQWMQTQLQEALEGKIKLQEELRASKAESIASTVKMDQLARENGSFLQQISVLQRGVLQDKARLVSELEAIEADVLSHEDSYTRLVAEKTQLEELARQRSQEIERLSAEVGQSRVDREELRGRDTERAEREESLVAQCQGLQRSKRELERKLQEVETELAGRGEEVQKLQRTRSDLQERVRESASALVGRDTALQGLKESQEILRRELEMVKGAQRLVEGELEEERRRVASMEASLAASQEGSGEEFVKSLQDIQQQLERENHVLRERVIGGEAEVRERERELSTAKSQSQDATQKLQELERKLETATRECESLTHSLMERDRAMARLARESEAGKQELERARSDRDHLQTKLNSALQQNSRLEGQLSEQSSLGELEELQVAARERTALRKDMEAVRLDHQQEQLQSQARLAQAEAELGRAKRETERAQNQLKKAVGGAEDAAEKLAELRSQKKRELEEVKGEVEREKRERREVEREVTSLRVELEEVQRRSLWLGREAEAMRGKLAHESSQMGEVERASGMVAMRLKQNAEERERELREENQALSLELEQLRGRLAGISITQQALKTHSCHLETALGDRDSSLTSLRAELERLAREKQTREGQRHSETLSLREELDSLQTELAGTLEQLHEEQSRCDQLTEELVRTTHELSQMKEEQLTEEKSLPALEERVSRLARGRDELRLELTTARAELVVARTAAEVAERELEDRKTQTEILQQKLSVAGEQIQEAERESVELRARLQRAEGRERRILFETSLSSIGGEEETDNAAPTSQDSSAEDPPTHHSLHSAQLRELGQQIERARRQGQEATEAKRSGEISVLRDALGSKSRTINSLQSCLVSLRGDMGKLQSKMQSHSATVRASHYTTRQLENQLADLKRSSSLQSPAFLSSSP